MPSRDDVVRIAASLLGQYGKGSTQVYDIWRDCLPERVDDATVHHFAEKAEWCGGFALHCLRLAGLTKAHWTIGSGFIYQIGLKRLTGDHWPKPGDIAVKEHPFSHHMVVEYWNNPNDWGDIAGNTPFAARHRHGSSVGIDFYSIEPLLADLRDTDPAPPRPVLLLGGREHPAETAHLQELLNRYMNAGLKVDGLFGPKTARAVQIFQRDKGLDADGAVGPATWEALDVAFG